MICLRGVGYERGNLYKYLKWLKLLEVVLYVCYVFFVIEVFKSLLVFFVKIVKFLGVVVLVLGLYMELKFENVVIDNEK